MGRPDARARKRRVKPRRPRWAGPGFFESVRRRWSDPFFLSKDLLLITAFICLLVSVEVDHSGRGAFLLALVRLVGYPLSDTEVTSETLLWAARGTALAWLLLNIRGHRQLRTPPAHANPLSSGNPAVRAAASRKRRST